MSDKRPPGMWPDCKGTCVECGKNSMFVVCAECRKKYSERALKIERQAFHVS